MITRRTYLHGLAATTAALFLGGTQPSASVPFNTPGIAPGNDVVLAGGDCYAVGSQVAASKGGQLAKVTAERRGGRDVCVVVVLVPGGNGQRPRREEVIVPND